jgi:hypothetical protein
MAKERRGSRVIKKYDPAKTPYQRTLASPGVAGEVKARLTAQYQQLDPVALLRQLEFFQDSLWQYAWRQASWVAAPQPDGVAMALPASRGETPTVKKEMAPEVPTRTFKRSGKLTNYHLVQHTWRTRPDPFVLVSRADQGAVRRESAVVCQGNLVRPAACLSGPIPGWAGENLAAPS